MPGKLVADMTPKEAERARVLAQERRDPEKSRASAKRWQDGHPDKRRENDRARYHRDSAKRILQSKERKFAKYGLTLEMYEAMHEEQKGLCFLCKRPEPRKGCRLSADHDHTTDRYRRLLCTPCNIGLGLFRDDVDLMRKAIEYLESFR